MTSDLEDAIADALRAKANAAPVPSMPPLGRAGAPAWPRRLVPVAAVLAVAVAVGAALFVADRRDNAPAAPPAATSQAPTDGGLAPGEVYYQLRLTVQGTGPVIQERELWQPRERAGRWQQKVAMGTTIENGRVVPGVGQVGAPDGGVCYPAARATDETCTSRPDWFNPTVEFLATAPRDPATIGEQLHALSAALVAAGGESGEDLVNGLTLRRIGELLAGNGVPPDLSAALREVAAALPGVTVTENMADLLGARGTGYSITHSRGGTVTVIFDAAGRYLGSPRDAVRHGVAPGLGQPPSRMLG